MQDILEAIKDYTQASKPKELNIWLAHDFQNPQSLVAMVKKEFADIEVYFWPASIDYYEDDFEFELLEEVANSYEDIFESVENKIVIINARDDFGLLAINPHYLDDASAYFSGLVQGFEDVEGEKYITLTFPALSESDLVLLTLDQNVVSEEIEDEILSLHGIVNGMQLAEKPVLFLHNLTKIEVIVFPEDEE